MVLISLPTNYGMLSLFNWNDLTRFLSLSLSLPFFILSLLNFQPISSSMNSILIFCLSNYVIRLLPFDNGDVPVERTGKSYRVKTPLDLFLPSSPILNRMKFG